MDNGKEMANRISEMALGYRQAQMLYTALDAGVFDLLKESRAAEDVARALSWDARAARIFLDGLLALGLVERAEGSYRNAAIASHCLVSGASAYQGNIVRHQRSGYDTWARMEVALRTGDSVLEAQRVREPEELRNFILGMSDIARFSARQILDAVDLSDYGNLLDVGGGPGTYSIAFLKDHQAMCATVFDNPDVVTIAREQVEEAGVADRFSYVAGDFTVDDLPSGFDLVLLSNIIHSYGPEFNRELVRKCFDALVPGGLLILKDFLVDDDRSGPPFSLIFALHMLIHTGQGDTYSAGEVAEWTDAAGFAPGHLVELPPPSRLWLARKP